MADGTPRKVSGRDADGLRKKLAWAERRIQQLKKAAHAEQALRESEERYRRLFEDDLTGDYLATVDGKLLDCNPAFVAILGFSSRSQALRTNLRALHPNPRDYDAFVAALRTARKLEHYECVRQRHDGVCINVVENVVAVSDAEDELHQIRGYLFDNTEAKTAERELREAEERYRNLIEFLPDAVVVSDAAERIVFGNPAAARLFGAQRADELIGRALLDVFVTDEHEAVRARTRAALEFGEAGAPARRTIRLPEGSRLHVDTAVTPMRYDGQPCVLRVNRDVTARVQAEERLLQKDREISLQLQKIEKLNSALTTLLEHREQETQQRLAGVRTMIEELVLAYVANLKATPLTAEQQVLLDIMEANLRNVTTSFARQIESWKMKLTPTELQIADLLRVGKRTKEIAGLLRVSPSAIAFHRNNIRAKLGLTRKPMNLVSYLRATAGSVQESSAPEGRRGVLARRRGSRRLRSK
jgi:PAS domain S-box-containing protein